MPNKAPVLHEILSVETSKLQSAELLLDEAKKQFKNNRERYEGFYREYTPDSADGDTFPPEEKNVEDTVADKLEYVFGGEKDYVNVAVIKEATNQLASADIIVDGVTLAENVPATGLLFLEKRVKRWLDLLNTLPTLDPAETWSLDENTGYHVSSARNSVREKKDLRWQIVAEPTVQHKAQYESWQETSPVGIWSKKRFSGAVSIQKKAEMIQRVKLLYEACVAARMRANMQEIKEIKIAEELIKYVIGQVKS